MKSSILEWQPGESVPGDFIALPHTLYRYDPHWLPEDPAGIAAAFGEHNPYFARNQARIWMVSGQVRLAGFFDPLLKINGEPVAFFGYWETTENAAINRQVFVRFERWAAAHGARKVYGPINFSTYGNYRIRLNLLPGEGCFPGEPYNPPYYAALLETCGYGLEALYQSQFIPDNQVENVYASKEALHQQMADKPFRIMQLQPDFWLDRLPEIYRMIDHTFRNNFAYAPISFETFAHRYGPAFAGRFCPQLSVAALNRQDQIIGFTLSFPDYAPLCRNGLAEPLKLSDIRYVQHFPLLISPTLLVKTLGVSPEYRQSGLMNAMGAYLMTHFRQYYARAMACLMKNENYSTHFFRNLPGVQIRQYGLYGKVVSE
jgi:hypothetical protein